MARQKLLKSYLERFDHAVLECPNLRQDSIMLTVHKGLRHEMLVKNLARKSLTIYPKFKTKAQEYINEELYMTSEQSNTISATAGEMKKN